MRRTVANSDFDLDEHDEDGSGHGHSHDHDDDEHEDWTKAQTWGYATLANTFLGES